MMKATKKPAAPKATAKATRPAAVATGKTPLRQWVATGPAFATAKPGENELPDYKKKAVPAGTALTALLIEDSGAYWRIKDGMIDGKNLPRNIRYIDKSQWRLLDDAAADMAAETAAEVPAAAARAAEAQAVATREEAPVHGDAPAAAAEVPAAAALAAGTQAAATRDEAAGSVAAAAVPPQAAPVTPLTVCIRGFKPLAPLLKPHAVTVEDGRYPYQKWTIWRTARATAVQDEAHTPAGRAVLEQMPAMPANHFESRINSLECDAYILSFPLEGFPGLHKSRSTGMILPLKADFMNNAAFSSVEYHKIADKAGTHLTETQWKFLQDEFEYLGNYDDDLLVADIEAILHRLRGRIVIFIMLNTNVGNAGWLLKLHARTNALLRPIAARHGVEMIELNDFVRTKNELSPWDESGASVKPAVHQQVAERALQILAGGRTVTASAAA